MSEGLLENVRETLGRGAPRKEHPVGLRGDSGNAYTGLLTSECLVVQPSQQGATHLFYAFPVYLDN